MIHSFMMIGRQQLVMFSHARFNEYENKDRWEDPVLSPTSGRIPYYRPHAMIALLPSLRLWSMHNHMIMGRVWLTPYLAATSTGLLDGAGNCRLPNIGEIKVTRWLYRSNGGNELPYCVHCTGRSENWSGSWIRCKQRLSITITRYYILPQHLKECWTSNFTIKCLLLKLTPD